MFGYFLIINGFHVVSHEVQLKTLWMFNVKYHSSTESFHLSFLIYIQFTLTNSTQEIIIPMSSQ